MADCKICGLASLADLQCADQAGARWGGFVFYPASPRHISLETAKHIADDADHASLNIQRVGLVVDANDDALDAMVTSLRPAMIQCHGNETPDRISAMKSRYHIPVMKALRIANMVDIENALRYDGIADWMLFDSAPQDAVLPGGTGHAFDWSLTRAYDGRTPWMLAGGLHIGNITDAIATSGAKHLDVSSGVESQPGVKDHAAIVAFVLAASKQDAPDLHKQG